MMASLKKQQVRTVLITEPFILTSSGRWEEAKQNAILATGKDGKPYEYDFYFGHTGLIDITKPAARDWFWQRYAELKTLGADGWWGDLGEPEVHPDDIRHAGGSAAEVHNIYGHEWAKLIAEKSARFYPKERPFILMRAGYSGSQRFGMIPWSGDVNRSWGGLRSQPEIALQMGMQGMAYMHSDLGGFAGAVDDDELYALVAVWRVPAYSARTLRKRCLQNRCTGAMQRKRLPKPLLNCATAYCRITIRWHLRIIAAVCR
jgi:alpha-glucosidase (family GH31 glycosyl hydrolase)